LQESSDECLTQYKEAAVGIRRKKAVDIAMFQGAINARKKARFRGLRF
jgi:hypothetical protein